MPFVVSKFSGVRQNRPKKNSFLPCFDLFRCPFDLLECRRTLGVPCVNVNICRSLYREPAIIESIQKETPPPFGERQVPSTPIIFRTKKVEKSSPQENIIFRTKNTAKSRLGLIGKNFGKNLWENVSGEKGSPQS